MRFVPAALVSLLALSACQPLAGPMPPMVSDRVASNGIRVAVRFDSPFAVKAAPKVAKDVASIQFDLLNADAADQVVSTMTGLTGTSFPLPVDGNYKVRATALDTNGNSIVEGTPPESGIIAVSQGTVTYPGGGTNVTLDLSLQDGTGETLTISVSRTGSGTPDSYRYTLLNATDDSQVAQYTSPSAVTQFKKVPDGEYKLTVDALKGGASITVGGAKAASNSVTVADGQVTYSDGAAKFLVSLTTASSGSWSAKASMPAGVLGGAATATSTHLYFLGGAGNSGPSNKVYAYEPGSNTWATKADLPGNRQLVAAASVGDKVYAIGGNDGVAHTAAVYVYDPELNFWAIAASMPKALFSSAATVCGGKIYVVGGNSFDTGVADSLYEYDPTTNSWATKASLPKALSSSAATSVDGKVYVFGGSNDDGDSKEVYAYDPASDTWTAKKAMAAARKEFAAAVGSDGRIYVTGGMVGGSMSSSVEAYDPATDTWAPAASLPTLRYVHSAAALGGKIYAMGGFDPNYMPLSSVLAFDL